LRFEVIDMQTMPRSPSENTFQVAFKIPEEWVKMADELAGFMSMPGVQMTRTDALRAALSVGLRRLHENYAKAERPEKTRKR
jgi:hypothetical protein